ncbi:hypothetical protein D6D13_07387 [Aureobasidium pullulans]|uniref:Uncharacterized protein n=1 Tax=Aureobasidium pullulans TaxID=5580 RepID=A0A4V4IZI8_AURPU|nr:hypothetical protein D6D13_07387 [Aureobasidium pullulans]
MNPRAPHYKFHAPASGSSNGADLATVFGSLRTNFVPATVPASDTVSSPRDNLSLGQEFLKLARAERQAHSDLMMHSKLLRLEAQVGELMFQRAATEKKQAESDEINKDLRSEVVNLKGQIRAHHDKLEICKRLADERARHARELDQRLETITSMMEPRFQHQETRINRVESIVRTSESSVTSQIKQHIAQLQFNDKCLAGAEQKTGDTVISKGYDGSKPQTNGTALQFPQADSPINKLEQAHGTHEKYLKTVGEALVAHQTGIDVANGKINILESKIEVLESGSSKFSGQQQVENGLFKMHPTSAAIVQMQSQIDRLTKDISHKRIGAESLKSGDSSANDTERLLIQMDEVHAQICEMEERLSSLTEAQRLVDECGMASKLRLEIMFYQLTKELLGKCEPEDVEYGLDEDRTFILRQRVLERLSIENQVQLEFLRLKESQQMPR